MTKHAHILWALLVIGALGGGYWLGRHGPASAPHPRAHHDRFRLALPSLSGRMRTLDHWPAKVYLVNFWAPWCPPCRAEIPLLKTVAARDRARGLVVVGIALDHKPAVSRYVHRHHIPYPVVLGGERALAMMAEYGDVQGAIPFSLFVSPHGRILTGRLGAFSPHALQADIHYAFKRR